MKRCMMMKFDGTRQTEEDLVGECQGSSKSLHLPRGCTGQE